MYPFMTPASPCFTDADPLTAKAKANDLHEPCTGYIVSQSLKQTGPSPPLPYSFKIIWYFGISIDLKVIGSCNLIRSTDTLIRLSMEAKKGGKKGVFDISTPCFQSLL